MEREDRIIQAGRRTLVDEAKASGLQRIALGCLTAHAIGIPTTWLQQGFNAATAVMLVLSAGYLLILWGLPRWPLKRVADKTVLCLVVEVLALTAATGGIQSPLLSLLPIVPIVAFTAGGPSRAWAALGGSVFGAATLAGLHQLDWVCPWGCEVVPESGRIGALLVALALMSVVLVWLHKLQSLRAEALTAALATAEEANRGRERLLAVSGHELRTPMNGVLGMLQLLQTTKLDKTQRHWVATAHASADSMASLVNGLIDRAAFDEGRVTLDERRFAVDQVLRQATELVSAVHGASVEVGDLPTQRVVADDRRLQQMVLNLLSNAARYAPGTPIGLRADLTGHELTDQGSGIPAEDLERVFEAHTRLIEGDGVRGLGLGLTISRALAEHMGGSLTLQSTPKGTTATLRLPVRDVREADMHTGPHPFRRALVIEDNTFNRRVITAALNRLEIDVDEAVDGQQGVRQALEGTYDVVFTDLHMPQMDGFEARRRIADARPDMLCVAVSADVHARQRAVDAGFHAFLPKPLDLGELSSVLDDLLG
jgi:signal transduction histidine kinase